MVLSRETTKEIEYHFYNYASDVRECEEITQDIAEQLSASSDASGVRGSNVSDPTKAKAESIEKKCGRLKRWCRVVELTRQHFIGNLDYTKLMEMVYEKKYSPARVCADLFIGEATYFVWKREIVYYAALKAVEFKLIKI